MLDYDDDYDSDYDDYESEEDDFYNDYDDGWGEDRYDDADTTEIDYDAYVPSRLDTLRFAFVRYVAYPFRHNVTDRIRRCPNCGKSRRNCDCLPF